MRSDVNAAAWQMLETLPRIMGLIRAGGRRSPDGLSVPQVRLLGMLEHRSAWTMGELAAAHSVSLPTMSNMVTTMERRGYAAREADSSDRRRVLVVQTPAGVEALRAVRRDNELLVAERLRQLPPENLRVLTDGLAVLEAAFPQNGPRDTKARTRPQAKGRCQ